MNKYNFEDFTEKKYRKIIKLAKKKYKFVFYKESMSLDTFIIWRHDIDFSIKQSKVLAQIEFDEGVKSIYFIQLGSKFYNIFESDIKENIFEIINFGHKVGLHFDISQYNIISVNELKKWLNFEKKILEKLLNYKINTFSFHIQVPEKFNKLYYCNMINASSLHFNNNKIGYCSDSNGYWRFDRLKDVIDSDKYKKLHILTHPVWWQNSPMSPQKRLKKCIDERSIESENWYIDVAKKSGRQIIE